MIRTFTREDYETLKPYEEHLVRAKYGRYVYGLRRPIFDVLVGVYKSLGYSQRFDYSCNGCLLNLCTTLGNYYFPFKEKLEKEQKNEEVNEGYGIKDEGTSYPVSPAQFDGEPIKEPQEENEEENPDFTEEDLEKAADEINEAIIKDIVESNKEPVTTKTNNTKTKKTNTRKKK